MRGPSAGGPRTYRKKSKKKEKKRKKIGSKPIEGVRKARVSRRWQEKSQKRGIRTPSTSVRAKKNKEKQMDKKRFNRGKGQQGIQNDQGAFT